MKLADFTQKQKHYILNSGLYSVRNGDLHDDTTHSLIVVDDIEERMVRDHFV